jgi:hypothetical protein
MFPGEAGPRNTSWYQGRAVRLRMNFAAHRFVCGRH